jgi:signal transduction histidine kinase
VVLLNTCCIRENADNRLYGHLGHLKAVKDRRPGMQIAVGGCLAQKDRELIQARAPQVDTVFGTHNLARAPALLREAATSGPVTEILDAAQLDDEDQFPSALPVRRDLPYTAWVTIQIGCDNSCAFCIVPAVRGREISRPFDDVVAEVARLVRSDVAIRKIPMTVDLAPGLPGIRGDRIQLQQVVLNMILNGLEAMGEPTGRERALAIRTARAGDAAVMVAVEDSGVGVDADDIEKMFEPLYTTKSEGLGMGLAIARTIVHAHGGQLRASNNPAGGATFGFILPASGEPTR